MYFIFTTATNKKSNTNIILINKIRQESQNKPLYLFNYLFQLYGDNNKTRNREIQCRRETQVREKRNRLGKTKQVREKH